MSDKNETGSQLFARLLSSQQQQSQTPKHSLSTNNTNYNNTQEKTLLITKKLENDLMINKILKIDSNVIPNGIENKSVVEIFGKVGCGKSELILHLISRYLMPPFWNINDKNCIDLTSFSIHEPSEFKELPKCIFINSDAKAFILRLFTIMETRINSLIRENQHDEFMQKQIKRFVETSLKNLVVYQSYDSEQFIYALAATETYIQSLLTSQNSYNYIIPIFIDSINPGYEFIDKFYKNSCFIDSATNFTENYTVNLIKKLTGRYNVCIIASRCDFYKNSENYSYKNWHALLNKRVELTTKFNNTNNSSNQLDREESDLLEKEELIQQNIGKSFQFKIVEYSTGSANKNSLADKTFFIKNSGFCIED